MFPACGVCSGWRAAGRRLFFASPWQEGGTISHPAGLFLLVSRMVDDMLCIQTDSFVTGGPLCMATLQAFACW